MTIRPMTQADWPRVSEIFQQGIDAGNATMHAFVPSYADFDAAREKAGRLVAEEGGVVIGWTALCAVSGRACYRGVKELAIYVDQDARGRGVGKTLLTALIEESERRGIWTLEAHIFEENAASRALHEKCGFRAVGMREKIGFDGFGVWHDVVLMERRSTVIEAVH